MPRRPLSMAIALASVALVPSTLTLLASSAQALSVAAPDTAWTGNGEDVSPTDSLVRNTCAVSDGAGGAYIAWTGRRTGVDQVYLQHLTTLGTVAPGWPLGGQLVSNPGVWSDHVVMVSDGNGGAYLAWDRAYMYGAVFYRHVPSSGPLTAGWAKDSARVLVAPPDSSGAGTLSPLKHENGFQLPTLAGDGFGGAYLAWQYNDWFYGTSILLRRIKPSGDPAPGWLAALWPGLGSYSTQYQSPVVCGDGEGGAFLAWMHWYTDSDIYALHVAGDRTVLAQWTSATRAVCAAPGTQSAPGLAPDGAGGAYVVWQDKRNGVFEQTYVQHLTADTSLAAGWPADGIALCTRSTQAGMLRATSVFEPTYYSSVIPDGAGGAIVAWTDFRSGTGTGAADIYAQRIQSDGTLAPGWTTDGVPLCTAIGDQELPTLASDGAGGAIVAWQDGRTGFWDICAQHVGADGAIAAGWDPNGRAICTAYGDQLAPFVCTDPSGGALVAWEDRRDDADHLYAARLSPDGTVAALASLVSAEAAPDRVLLAWALDDRGAVATVYRRDGATDWRAVAERSPDGLGRIEFEDRDVKPASRYGYRLGIRSAGDESFAGETWVDVPGLALALTRVSPNPSRRAALRVDFVLADRTPATLELLDVTGRRALRSEIGAPEPGPHSLGLPGAERLAAGIYWVRLSQGARAALMKTVMLR